MSKKCYSTFDPWVQYEQGEPYSIPKESIEADYQSSYVTKFNRLKEAGWVKKKGGWINPNYPKGNYTSIDQAHQALVLWEVQNG